MKEGAPVLGAELTESVVVSSLESDVYVSFIIRMILTLFGIPILKQINVKPIKCCDYQFFAFPQLCHITR